MLNIKNLDSTERYLKFKSYITAYKTLTDGIATIRRIIKDLNINFAAVKSKAKEREVPEITLENTIYTFITVHYPEYSLEVLGSCVNVDVENPRGQVIEYALVFESVEKYLSDHYELDLTKMSITDEQAQQLVAESKKPKKKKEVREKIDLAGVRKTLKSNLKGQDHVIDKILEKLTVMEAGLRPFTSLYFMGKSGTGKTMACKLLAQSMFGTKDRLVQIDCASFKHDHDDSKIFGSAPGYVGYGDDTVLAKAAKKSNAWVILFDEFEKSGPAFQDTLLRLLDDGKVVGANGKELDFSRSIFVFTSNLGTDKVTKDSIGLQAPIYTKEELTDAFINELKKTLKPEFVNRLRDVVVFNILDEITIREIIEDHLAHLPIKPSTRLVSFILETVNFHDYGARDVDKKIESLVEPILAKEILKVKETDRDKTRYIPKLVKGKLSFVQENKKSS